MNRTRDCIELYESWGLDGETGEMPAPVVEFPRKLVCAALCLTCESEE
jgi:hypothetical protein